MSLRAFWLSLRARTKRGLSVVYVALAVMFAVICFLPLVLWASGLDPRLQEGIKIAVPTIALIWAMFTPLITQRQAHNRIDRERAELRTAAVGIAEQAATYLRVRRDEFADMSSGRVKTLYPDRSGEFIEALGAFKPDKLPHAALLIGMEEMRGVLRRCASTSQPFRRVQAPGLPDTYSPGFTPEDARDISTELAMMSIEADEVLGRIRNAPSI